MDRLFERGFAAPAADRLPDQILWYLPCFGARNPNKPGKVRLVFDAAAKSWGVCFNDLLNKGPDLINSLIGVIMRFRRYAIAFKGDMFLKVKLREHDWNAQRFLWRDRDRASEPKEFVMTSLLFGKSSPCEAILVKNKNAREFSTKYPEAAESIVRNSYVDDYLDSCSTKQQTCERIKQVIEIYSSANWELHGCASNDFEVVSNVCGDSGGSSVPLQFSDSDDSSQLNEKVLGLFWDTNKDCFGFRGGEDKIDSSIRDFSRAPTKREFLKIIMSLFYSLGFLSPLIIQARILMQEVWASKIGWDQALLEVHFEKWKQWLKELSKIHSCRVQRCYQLAGYVSSLPELHMFCDASEKAFATVGYWRFVCADGRSRVAFVASKARVAPTKTTTIPRLELQAALLAVRLAQTIESEHDFVVSKRYFWSDSKTVLSWINSDPKVFKTFVANRLGEIREGSLEEEWRWVPSALNPADDATRLPKNTFNSDCRWLQGPSFLLQSCEFWPKVSNTSECVKIPSELAAVHVHAYSISTNGNAVLPDVGRFSSWSRLIGATARVIEACDRFRKRTGERDCFSQVEQAEILWFKHIQASMFAR
ncbi:hypothetical protein TKK_0007958 [Trichogramma kaykai]